MRWNWDFIRGRKTELDNSLLRASRDGKLISVNGSVHQIQGAHLSDMEVAGQVRMLRRGQLNHESVCTLARDRIVYLADRLGEIEATSIEAIARIIDPTAWKLEDGYWVEQVHSGDAIGKAEQILALITGAPAAIERQEPPQKLERQHEA